MTGKIKEFGLKVKRENSLKGPEKKFLTIGGSCGKIYQVGKRLTRTPKKLQKVLKKVLDKRETT